MSEHLQNVRRMLQRGIKMAQADIEDLQTSEVSECSCDVLIGRYIDTFQHALDELFRELNTRKG